jgi:hypothetical protein
MLGDDGGYGKVYFLAALVASKSCPAKTVVRWFGFLGLLFNASFTPGLQVPAAHPQTELITSNMVPWDWGMV